MGGFFKALGKGLKWLVVKAAKSETVREAVLAGAKEIAERKLGKEQS